MLDAMTTSGSGPTPRPIGERIGSSRPLWRLGLRQMVVTVVVVIVLNLIARRLGLSFTGGIVLCAAVALAWPFLSSRWRRR